MGALGSAFESRLARLERATGNFDLREINLLDVHRLISAKKSFETGEISAAEFAAIQAEVGRKRIGPFARDMLALARKRSEQQ